MLAIIESVANRISAVSNMKKKERILKVGLIYAVMFHSLKETSNYSCQ